MIAGISVDAAAVRLLAVRASNLAIQAFGGYGYVDEYQVQKLLIGRAETGVSAFL